MTMRAHAIARLWRLRAYALLSSSKGRNVQTGEAPRLSRELWRLPCGQWMASVCGASFRRPKGKEPEGSGSEDGWRARSLEGRVNSNDGFPSAGVKRLEVRQVGQEDHTDEWIDASTGANGSSALTITPRVLGLVRFLIRAEFGDGSYDMALSTINVSVDPKIVSDFMIHPNHFPKLIVEMAGGHGNAFGLYPSLTARGLDESILVGKFASFRLVLPDADPAVTVDGNGVVTVHHPGHSIIEASFAGKVDRVTVEVE